MSMSLRARVRVAQLAFNSLYGPILPQIVPNCPLCTPKALLAPYGPLWPPMAPFGHHMTPIWPLPIGPNFLSLDHKQEMEISKKEME